MKKKRRLKTVKQRRCPEWADRWPWRCPLPGSAAYEKLDWPEEVPILTGEDLVKQHPIPLGPPPYALDGWRDATFGDVGQLHDIVSIALDSVIHRRLGRKVSAWEFLLDSHNTKDEAAAVWKEAMILLGYNMDRPVKHKKNKVAPVEEYDHYFD